MDDAIVRTRKMSIECVRRTAQSAATLPKQGRGTHDRRQRTALDELFTQQIHADWVAGYQLYRHCPQQRSQEFDRSVYPTHQVELPIGGLGIHQLKLAALAERRSASGEISAVVLAMSE
jgi:hypothetical protein